jgi:alpha-L-rhamnosidase
LTIKPGKHEYVLRIPRHKSHYPHSQVMPEHMPEVIPFRYCEIVCGDAPLTLISARQMALYTLFDEGASAFSSDVALLNDVYDLCRYSIKANTFIGDYAASQRERMMYEADAYIHQLGHYAVDREFSVARYSLKNMVFHATWPTEWISQSIFMAWADYMHTGNLDFIRNYYQELKPKTLTALTEKNGLISTRTGKQTRAFVESIHLNRKALRDIVDWPHGGQSLVLEGGETDDYEFTDFNTVVNAFHYQSPFLSVSTYSRKYMGKDQSAGERRYD